METTLEKSGKVGIPKAILDKFGFKTGEVFKIEKFNDEIILKPIRTANSLRTKNGIIVFAGSAAGDIAMHVGKHRNERLKKAASWKK